MTSNIFSLEGKTVFVTGASSGIGRGIALQCAIMGADVILNGRNRARLEETLRLMKVGNHTIIEGDLSQQSEIERIAEALPEIQGWVNSAGIPIISPVKRMKREDVFNVLNVNTVSSMMLMSLLIKRKKLKRKASIVFISSVSGNYVGTPGDTAYQASKGAICAFAKGAAVELASQGIRVNCINPGLVPTSILDKANRINEEGHMLEIWKNKYPLKRLGTPEDIGSGAVFLLSDAASWITGQNIIIDGGMSIS